MFLRRCRITATYFQDFIRCISLLKTQYNSKDGSFLSSGETYTAIYLCVQSYRIARSNGPNGRGFT